jgi:3-phenylpropionate/trans-cinnamate dioxygenase ferredoxin subunit
MNSDATPQMRKYVIGHIDAVPEGGRLIVEIDGREIGIYRLDGSFYAMLNRCPHLGGPLCEGQVVNEVTAAVPGEVRGNLDKTYITCPWHNWEFDIKTGQSYWNPKGLRSRPIPIAVESATSVTEALDGGRAQRVKGPYQAETLPVGVEQDYVVLTLRVAGGQDGAPTREASVKSVTACVGISACAEQTEGNLQ